MLSKVEQAQQRWGGANPTIDNWLSERQQLLIQFCALAGLPPYERNGTALPANEDIQSFCELLVDYVSAGHFEVYDQLAGNTDTSDQQAVYSQISVTTEHALTFNDQYASEQREPDYATFDVKLSALGQQLEARFALEDQLIQDMHTHN